MTMLKTILSTVLLPSLALSYAVLPEQAFAQTTDSKEAEQLNKSKSTLSVSGFKKELDKMQALDILASDLSTTDALTRAEQATIALKGMTREQVHAQKKQGKFLGNAIKLNSDNLALSNVSSNTVNSLVQTRAHHSFSIFEGYAQLIVDDDADGFYKTFSVTFDADVYNPDYVETSLVYADLYLSIDGGDWEHYYTTSNFIITGDSTDDAFEVYTTLDQGYIAGHYDVLIDLYEVGYPDIVATYSAADANELYALPLESADYDTYYETHYYHHHDEGGSIPLISIAFLLGMTAIRCLPKAKAQN